MSIEFSNLRFKYFKDQKLVLNKINLSIKPGSFVVLTGKSGCGKTTLTRCINGLIPHHFTGYISGSIKLLGQETEDLKIHQISKLVGSVFQDPRSQFFTTNTTRELAFGLENIGVPRDTMVLRVQSTFNNLQLNSLSNRNIFKLSSGEKQKIAIASIVALDPDVYVFDEPSANLDPQYVQDLTNILKMLKEQGKTVVIAEHRLHYLRELADQFILLDSGQISEIFDNNDPRLQSIDFVISKGMRPLDLSSIPQETTSKGTNISKPTLCNVEDISYQRNGRLVLDKVNFSLKRGEVLGIIGSNGSGKTTLIKIISGLLKETGGSVYLSGKKVKRRTRRAQTFLVIQDVIYQLFASSVKEELGIGIKHIDDLPEKIEETLMKLSLSKYRETQPALLSGGEMQRVGIAVAMLADTDLILLDEPTSGIDGAAIIEVQHAVNSLVNMGKTVIMVTHDYQFLMKIATRILILESGKVQDEFDISQRHEKQLLDRFT